MEIRYVTAVLFLFLKVSLQWDFEMLALQKQTQVTKQFSLVSRFLTQHWYNYKPNETLKLKTTKIYTNFAKRGIIIFFSNCQGCLYKIILLNRKAKTLILKIFFSSCNNLQLLALPNFSFQFSKDGVIT